MSRATLCICTLSLLALWCIGVIFMHNGPCEHYVGVLGTGNCIAKIPDVNCSAMYMHIWEVEGLCTVTLADVLHKWWCKCLLSVSCLFSYQLLLRCWDSSFSTRPSFGALVTEIEAILEGSNYMNFSVHEDQ